MPHNQFLNEFLYMFHRSFGFLRDPSNVNFGSLQMITSLSPCVLQLKRAATFPPFVAWKHPWVTCPLQHVLICNSQMSEPMDTDSEPRSPKSQAFLAMRAFLTKLKHSFRNVPLYAGTDLPTWIFRHARAIQP